uniref:Uncharacterized protein n=1 Tax=Arundo donax TaxID=35708 RepID=A0A0A9BEP7_ARUDO
MFYHVAFVLQHRGKNLWKSTVPGRMSRLHIIEV